MYDWPEVRGATDAWWNGIARHLNASIPLSRDDDYAALWQRPDLLFSQTCGYPFTHEFAGQLRYVATPHYAAEGCGGANYASMVFARRAAAPEDFRGAVAAVNAGEAVVVYPEGVWYTYVDESDIDEIVDSHLKHGIIVDRLLIPADLAR